MDTASLVGIGLGVILALYGLVRDINRIDKEYGNR